ncbi:hypothetical protein OESDEN_06955 [Oesophagostomum dentatum]|uniref:Uncharacterized protein n=1 Tax=Oesophagostomum dentatum TaxID=61180 RepID=A0A0B1T7F8_OESDE|nr:hypothetical protein OESDEN_06955 [Oesophagostomum dentatum]
MAKQVNNNRAALNCFANSARCAVQIRSSMSLAIPFLDFLATLCAVKMSTWKKYVQMVVSLAASILRRFHAYVV